MCLYLNSSWGGEIPGCPYLCPSPFLLLLPGYFAGAPADYVFMLLFNALCLLAMGLFMGFPILSSALVFSVVYVWCQINKDIIVNFWFGVQVKVLATAGFRSSPWQGKKLSCDLSPVPAHHTPNPNIEVHNNMSERC